MALRPGEIISQWRDFANSSDCLPILRAETVFFSVESTSSHDIQTQASRLPSGIDSTQALEVLTDNLNV